MRKCLLSLLIFLFSPSLCFGQDNAIRFNVTPLGFPPYIFSTPPGGIIFDVLNHIAVQHSLKVVPVRVSETRVQVLLDNHKLDAHASALEWIENPEKYLFTQPIVKVRDLVFTREDSSFNFQKIEDLYGQGVGVRTGYSYQSLTHHFKSGKIKRLDSNNELYMLNMLSRGRLDIAIITEYVGLWLIKENTVKQRFKISKNAIDTTDYRLVFTKKWQPFVNHFNKELSLMKRNGQLENILSKYR